MKLRSADIKLLSAGAVRRTTWRGRETLVAPVTILVEGVHAGSAGPYLYTAEELRRTAEAWNGVPLPVHHPTSGGAPIAANTPQVIEETSIGQLFNVVYDADKKSLRGEVWIDVTLAEQMDPAIVPMIEDGQPLEVSTGLYSDEDGVAGEWNGESYQGRVLNIRPDHLALLPGAVGACSWTDGCGVRANAKGTLVSNVKKQLRCLHVGGRKLLAKYNEASHSDIRRALQTHVDSLDGNGWYHVVEDVFDEYFIFCAYGSEPGGAPRARRMFKQGYSVSAEGQVTVTGDPVEVREERSYVPVSAASPAANARAGEDPMDRKKTIERIMANCPHFTADDRVGLEKLSDGALKAMESQVAKPAEEPKPEAKPDAKTEGAPDPAAAVETPAPVAPAAAATPEATTPALAQNAAPKPITLEEYLANAPGELRDSLRGMVSRDEAHRKELVSLIRANTACPWSEEELLKMNVEKLTGLIQMTGAKAPNPLALDFTLRNGHAPQTNAARVPEAPSIW